MQIAGYIGPPVNDVWHSIGHYGIRLVTWSRYSHCEVVFGAVSKSGLALCGSSSARDGGVRLKAIEVTSGRWELRDLRDEYSSREAEAYQWFKDHEGAGYDYFGLPYFVLPIAKTQDPGKWLCSEACGRAVRAPEPAYKYHPGNLIRTIT